MELDRYRKILVGTDGSSLAGPTVTRAARLAVADDADLIVVCAYTKLPLREAAKEPNIEGSVATLGQVPGSEAATLAIQEAMQVAHAEGARVTAALLVDSDPVAAILETARDNKVDAIVIGAIRDTSIAGRLLGTVSSDVVRRAHRDVLIVRPTEDAPEPAVAEDVHVADATED
ncbi:universal stress protein [Propionibacterium australiense]|uniref:USP_Like n=1 Tax=Propionibacterium australiense TaxID=119981 RepID=A0A383S303_9ACTN|nr:universal stress protein [Propionibacterium australiense]RLP06459.1 universal stress protein [Propionibacterium australiense]RLP11596.1 universal stress protein [Propionibacterium australiense]SYZ32317.1 USP_Like [Propionibacterium australiense]VEH90452.1 Universal stress protein Rv1636/MT1672 [Propionibacterium australiense]